MEAASADEQTVMGGWHMRWHVWKGAAHRDIPLPGLRVMVPFAPEMMAMHTGVLQQFVTSLPKNFLLAPWSLELNPLHRSWHRLWLNAEQEQNPAPELFWGSGSGATRMSRAGAAGHMSCQGVSSP